MKTKDFNGKSSQIKKIKEIEVVMNNSQWVKNENGSFKCYTCGEYSIHEFTEKHKLSFWINKEKADFPICRKCLAFSVGYKEIYTIDPIKKKRDFPYYVYASNLKKWINKWSKTSKEIFSSIKDVKKVEARYKGTQHFNVITGNGDKFLCPERRLKGWIENIKNKETKSFLFIYEIDEYEEMVLKKVFPVWENYLVEKKLGKEKKFSSDISENKIRKMFQEEFEKRLNFLLSYKTENNLKN
ncbi:MAG: hypothetical protein I3273_07635 [Candidatus Moeniiplasma glomeromycotorum]|nr:hypothetical protein [Candidatus Moeniiplasma glomeromycotorum]MCE8168429.1 hypothetical protein [Candidatus Moeniiplasma glomeromycotorum]MCE8169951.1 hypothetical protein [Candidatus Moeniiplasma glomeromycotorum]